MKLVKNLGYLPTVIIALALVLGVASFSSKALAAEANIGVVDFQLLLSQHPDMAAAQETMKLETEQAQKDFDDKTKTMTTDAEKEAYHDQLQQRLDEKKQTLFASIGNKVIAAIKAVADAKGITVVVDKETIMYGGQDITSDVGKQFSAQ
jgi:outer membrane protein